MNNLIYHSNFFRLSTVRGNGEARTELYKTVLRKSTGADDEVMCQESAGYPAKPGIRADGGEV